MVWQSPEYLDGLVSAQFAPAIGITVIGEAKRLGNEQKGKNNVSKHDQPPLETLAGRRRIYDRIDHPTQTVSHLISTYNKGKFDLARRFFAKNRGDDL